MTQSDHSGPRAELTALIEELLHIIERQGGSPFSPGLRAILATLQDRSIDEGESVREASRTYIGITGSPDSLSDFFVWDDDFEARTAQNVRLNEVRARIWQLVQGAQL